MKKEWISYTAHVGACSVSSDGRIQSAEWGDFDLNSTKTGLKTAFPSEQSQSRPEKRSENRSKFSHCLLTDLHRVPKRPSIGAKSVSFAEAGPDYQRLTEQNQSVDAEKRGLTQPSEHVQSASPPVGPKSVKTEAAWKESCVGANSVTQSLLTFASESNIHKQRLWQITQ